MEVLRCNLMPAVLTDRGTAGYPRQQGRWCLTWMMLAIPVTAI
jgi:hypothetical protein